MKITCKVVGKYVVPFCITPDKIDTKGMSVTKEMVADIVGK